MISLGVDKLNDVYQWLDFIVNTKDVYIESENTHLKLHCELNTQYLVINYYMSDNEAIEYYFKSNKDANSLEMILDYVKSNDYSVAKIIKNLHLLDYKRSNAGNYAVVNGGKIFMTKVKSN